MKNIRHLAMTVFLSLLMVLSLGFVLFATAACDKQDAGETLDGTFYADVNGEEYTFDFDGASFTFNVAGKTLTGTYRYDGTTLTLTAEGEETITATFEDGMLKVTYQGTTYDMLAKTEYTVTYQLNGGTGETSAKVVNGRTLTRPADPTKEGSVFVGWYEDSAFTTVYTFTEPVTADLTLYARFVTDPGTQGFVVSYETGSDYTGEPIADTETVGGHIYASQLPALPAQNGKAFLGWWMSDSEDAAKLTAMVKDGQALDENTTLYAVWDNGAPAVSVTSEGVSWLSMGVNVSYTVTIKAPGGAATSVNGQITGALSQAFDFASAQEGEYTVTVTASGKTTTAYYTNKALARVSLFSVDGFNLTFNAVEGAEYYLVSYECGTVGHTHDSVRTDTNTYDFSDCDMKQGGISFVVQAVAEGYVTSSSAPYVFERHLDQAANLSVNKETDVLTWDAVDNAQYYMVTVKVGDQTFSVRTEEATLALQSYYGDLQIGVVAYAFGYNPSAEGSVQYAKTRLATPANISTSGDTIRWDAVEGAAKYIVTIGDEQFEVTENSFRPDEEDLAAVDSEFTVTVQAIAADAANNSFAGTATLSRKLTNLAYSNGVLSWSPVLGVSQYGVRVNGGEETLVEGASAPVTLTQAGENVLSVRYYTGSEASDWIDITVNASVTVTLNTNTGASATESYRYFVAGDKIRLSEEESRLGYTFNGWFTAANGGQKVESGTVSATANVTYYAQWTANTYTVTLAVTESEGYFENGAEHVYSMEVDVTFGSAFSFPVPFSADGTRAFYGWYSEFGGTGIQYTDPEGASLAGRVWNLASDQTFYVRWVEAFTYTLIANPLKPSERAYSISQGQGIGYLTRVTVPALYNGLPVTTIEGSCFADCAKLVTINIPDSIVSVFTGNEGSNSTGSAFYRCSALTEINVYDASASFTGNYEKFYSSYDGMLIYDNPYGAVELSYVPIGITGEVTIPDTVQTIPLNVFRNTNVTVINVPASVTSIGEHAFNSSKIVEVNFLPAAEGETAQPLTIGSEAFLYSKIVEITLPARLTSFNTDIFTSCNYLEKVHVEKAENSVYTSDDGVVFTDKGATLYYCPAGKTGVYTVGSSVTANGDRAFYRCTDLEGIVIPGNVSTIGTEAFYGCSGLKSITFQGKAKDPALTIEEYAFYSCSGIKELTLPENLKVLGAYAFGNISGLTTVTVETAIAEIEYSNGAFASEAGTTYVKKLILGPNVALFDVNGVFGSTSLTSVDVDPGNPNYESEDGVLFNKGKTRIVYYPSGRPGSYVLPETVEEIGANVFFNNDNLTSITFGTKITTIGDSAFEDCDLLTSIIFTNSTGTLTIGKKAFFDCDSLTTVVLPEGKDSIVIGDEAFSLCYWLANINFPEGVTSIGHAAFNYCNGLTEISLPASLESLAFYSTSYQYTAMFATPASWEPETVAAAGTDNIDAFNYCVQLANITVAEGHTHYGAIDGVLYGKNAETGALETLYFSPISNVGVSNKVTIPATVKEVKDRAFFSNRFIKAVDFEEREASSSITFGSEIFSSAGALESVSLPAGVTEIPDYMFRGASLKSIFIPNTVTRIGEGAFFACSTLEEVRFEEGGTAPLVIADGTSESFGSGGSSSYTNYYGAFAGCTSLKEIEFPERTTEIGNYAFYKSSSSYSDGGTVGSGLVSVVIPSTVTRIGQRAFSVSTLQNVTFTAGTSGAMAIENYACYRASIINLVMSDTVATIGDYAFQDNEDLVTVSLPASLTSIGASAFNLCDSLTSVTFAENGKLQTIGTGAFSNDTLLTSVNLENCSSITEIGGSAFSSTGLTKVVLPASITTVGASAFSGCASLASVEFLTAAAEEGAEPKSNLQSVGTLAFAKTALTLIEFPESNSNITLGDYLFSACNTLTDVHLSTSIVDIGSAFTQCMSINTISVAAGNKNYKGHETDPLLLNVEGTTIVLAYGPVTEEGSSGEYTLPEGLQVIGESAFAGQNGIRKLIIPASVTVIEASAFEFCRSLETVEFAEGSLLTEIGKNAFSDCYSLKSINLPEGLAAMGMYAFQNNISLKEIVLPSTLSNIGNYAFKNCVALEKVNVPVLVSATGYTASSLFQGCTSLKDVTFSEDTYWIPSTIFDGCTALTTVTFPATITEISNANKMFKNSGLQSIDLGGLTEIPNYMFCDSKELTTVNLSKITTIGTYAFQNCAKLVNVDLSKVLSIGNYAFSGCSALEEADLSNATTLGTYVFRNNVALKHVTLNDALASIGNYAFSGCTLLDTIDVVDLTMGENTNNEAGIATLPGSLNSIGTHAFQQTAIREITIPRSIKKLSSSISDTSASSSANVFSGCMQLEKVILHDELTVIGGNTFSKCGSLTTVRYVNSQGEIVGKEGEVTLPESLTVLGNQAFGSGRGTSTTADEGEVGAAFTKVTVPESVKYFGSYAFQDCALLEEAIVLTSASRHGTSSTSYAVYTFDGCTSLKRIVFNDGVTAFGYGVFRNCTSLSTIDVYTPDDGKITENEAGVAVLPSALAYVDYNVFMNTAIREITIPRGVTSLAASAKTTSRYGEVFSGCTQLETVILHDALQMIGKETFLNCSSLRTIMYLTEDGTLVGEGEEGVGVANLPGSLTMIGDNAFNNTAIEKVIIPESVAKIGDGSFSNCASLKEVQYLTSSVRYNTATSNYATNVFENDTALSKVVLNSEITYLPDSYFLGCSSLTTILLYNPADKTTTGNEGEALLPQSLTELAQNVFKGCSSITKMILPATLETIGTGVFNGMKGLTSLELPEGLTSVGADAFYNTGLTEIEVPASVTSIGDNAFNGLTVTVAEGNQSFAAMTGILMTVTGTILSVPKDITGIGGEFTVPEEVTSINGYALNGITGITHLTISTDQLSDYSLAYFHGDVTVTLGESKTLASYAFGNYRGTAVTLPEGLEAIGDHAFYGATNMVSVSIPDTVNSIDKQIFRDCTSLKSVVIPEGVEELGGYTFNNNTSLTSVTLPSTLKEMGNNEFANCTSLTSIVLPEGLQEFGTYLFQNCTSLEEVTILSFTETTNFSSSSKPFNGCTALKKVILGDGVTAIPGYLFHEMADLTEIQLPAGVTSIGNYAFRSSGLKSIVIPATATSIGTYVFADCTALETVYIPETLTSIGNDAFLNCTSLKTIYTYRLNEEGEMEYVNSFGEGVADLSCVTSLGNNVFENCTALTGVQLADTYEKFGDSVFTGSGLKSVTVPGGLGILYEEAFMNCTSLETVVIGEGITELETSVFKGCTALKSVTLPESLVEIGSSSFNGCTSVEEIVIPASVTSIMASAFAGWTAEQTITAYVYALDSACAWNTSWVTGCLATMNFVVLYSYENDAEVAA